MTMQVQHPLSGPVLERVAHRMMTLGQPMRIRILECLQAESEMRVQAIADALNTTQQNVSRHLALLLRDGIVDRRQEGRVVWYWITDGGEAIDLIEQTSEYVVRDLRDRLRPW
jgi:DNA-binding transcriptional ArsR family regulator